MLKGKIPQKYGRLGNKIKLLASFFSHARAIMSLRGGGGRWAQVVAQLRADRNSMQRKEPRTRRWYYWGTRYSYKRPNSELKVDMERMH